MAPKQREKGVRKPPPLRQDPWFRLPADEVATAAWKWASDVHGKQASERSERANDCLALYEGNAARQLGLLAATTWGMDPATFNAIGSVVDTRASHVYRNKVRPFFLTSKGSWEERERAKGMQEAVEGTFHEAGVYGELGQHVCWDGETSEAGCVKVTPDYANKRILLERLRAQDVYVDTRDAQLGRPRTFAIINTMDRAELLDFCKDEGAEVLDAIRDAAPAPASMYDEEEAPDEGETSDRVQVAELWHLPSGCVDRDQKEAWEVGKQHDGRHTIVLVSGDSERIALLDEAWPFSYPPIAFYRPKKRRRGFWSQSVPERLVGAQLSINRMLKRVDGIMNLHARPLVYVNKQARVNTDKITNSWASIIEGNGPAGNAIQYITPQSVPAEYIAQIQRIIGWCFEQEGVSELSASAKKPAGIEAAVAIQALQDTESIRHTDVFRAWEDFHVDLARITVDAIRMLAEHVPDFEVMWGDAKDLRAIRWKNVDLDDLKWHLMVWPTNLLPQTPSAKLQRITDLMAQKLITPQQGLMLLDFPDIEALTGDSNAALKNIEEKLNAVVKGKDDASSMPHPYLQLDLAWRLAIDRINRLESEGAPRSQIDLVIQWAEDVKEFRDKLLQEQAPGGPAGPPQGAPPGAPPPVLPAQQMAA
jgi:hypothetical protein